MASLPAAEDNSTSTSSELITSEVPNADQLQSMADFDNRGLKKNAEAMLRDAVLEADLMWSFFVSAAKSYRFSSVLHPIPPMHNEEDNPEKQIDALREVVSRMPKFSSKTDFASQLPTDCHTILRWVLEKPKFQLQLREKEECFRYIRTLTGQVMDASEPMLVVEVVYDDHKEEEFIRRRGSRKTFFAYHGSRFDNFYSILHNGLNIHLNKVSAFGEGTYLSSELSVSLLYSQAGEAWSRSCVGAKLACVAVCEMIDDPSVKCQTKEGSALVQKQRAQASRITDAVPDKYYVVQNNDVVRVKYLLVYKDQSAPVSSVENQSSYSWLYQHKFPLLMLAYFVILIAIGLANSRQANNAVKRFFRRLNFS